MCPGHMLLPTCYVTGVREREVAGHEFSEFLLRHWTLDDTLSLVSMTKYKIHNSIQMLHNDNTLIATENTVYLCNAVILEVFSEPDRYRRNKLGRCGCQVTKFGSLFIFWALFLGGSKSSISTYKREVLGSV